jgi:Zn-dependent oligopeptidase
VPEVLKQLGRHYSYLSQSYYQSWRMSKDHLKSGDGDAMINPDEAIPDRLLHELLKTKGVNSAVEMLKQIHSALFDLAVHTPKDHDIATDVDISGLWNNIRVGLASSSDDSRGDREQVKLASRIFSESTVLGILRTLCKSHSKMTH